MGSSQTSIYNGRRRHGFGQYFMGSDPLGFTATAAFRALEPPYVTGGLAMLQGFFGAMIRGERRLDDPELRRFIRRYQRQVLFEGGARAMAETEAERAEVWQN